MLLLALAARTLSWWAMPTVVVADMSIFELPPPQTTPWNGPNFRASRDGVPGTGHSHEPWLEQQHDLLSTQDCDAS
jgi:hypothetical protein